MATENKKLSMTFGSAAGSEVTITVDYPAEDLAQETVSNAMEDLAQLGVFVDKENQPLTLSKSAKITTTTVQELF